MVGFIVVSVLLLLFGETSKEVGVVVIPATGDALPHPLFTSFMVGVVDQLSSMESLHLLPVSIKDVPSLLRFDAGLVDTFLYCQLQFG